MNLAEGYYAVPDPDDQAVITCWRWSSKRGLRRWTGGASYGTATTPSRGNPAPPHTTPVKAAWRDWFYEVLDAIKSDPHGAQARFGQITGRCYSCSKRLTDPESVSLGIGPDCRRQ